jgi:DNA-directed RNA polymerase subunit RPC12/RpoP
MNRTYLVVGEQGEYSDRMEWCVAAYSTLAQATEHCRLLAEWFTKVMTTTESGSTERETALLMCVLDQKWAEGQSAYGDEVRYNVVEVPEIVHADEYVEAINDHRQADIVVVEHPQHIGQVPPPPNRTYKCPYCQFRMETPRTGPISCTRCPFRPLMNLVGAEDAADDKTKRDQAGTKADPAQGKGH